MSYEDDRTRAGLFGDLAGKAKEAMGELLGSDELAEDGRDQQERVEDDDAALRAEQAED
ncbi:hypothetical protein NBH00_23565 [Paraconexibacter antarcticus]|uniref:CsbD family protein n=1 Tax=Paraconexibacter antarcticus TaxID=2949664 RepID=A0ABY5DTK9_9ACTN|nr:hypothetical protein [Paraconexibacter antarcticus]UTI64306.1 hypothetical protein NBH00_23565 [Paraconexibacter antarcticus]